MIQPKIKTMKKFMDSEIVGTVYFTPEKLWSAHIEKMFKRELKTYDR